MDFFLLIFGLIVLSLGAEAVVRGSVSLGKKLKISLFAIGVVVVSAGTSLPELASSLEAVISNHSDIAVGAIVGSNIANIILIMGATTLLCPISGVTQNQINQSIICIFIALSLILMSIFFIQFNFIFGFISLVILIAIMTSQIKKGSLDFSDVDEKGEHHIIISLFFILIGIIFLIYGSKFFVGSAINIATTFGVSESVIGATLVALGTSLPELSVGILSALRRKVDFALGNVLGSNIYNILGVLGISSFFANFSIPYSMANFDLYVMTAVIILITLFMVVKKRLGRTYGIMSLLIYSGYISFLYY
jgi:cation:H+ antiporter